MGNRLTMQEASGQHTYGYDDLYELTSANYPTGFAFADTSFTYDSVGNRTQVTVGSTSIPYGPNNLNQYATVGSLNFTYDPNGNLTNDTIRTYTYDAENRLITAQGSGLGAQYTYDAFGRRIKKDVNGQVTRYLYDGDQLLAETNASGTLTSKYLYGPGIDEPLRMTRGGVTSYYHFDGLGSIIALTDSTGTPTLLARYDVYGQPFLQIPNSKPVAPSGTAFGFTGREYDQETGLYHYRARTYNALIGRFHQRDPLTRGPNDFRMFGALNADNALQGWLATTPRLEDLQRSSLSLTNFIQQRLLTVGGSVPVLRLPYLYVLNNPVNFVDPFGLYGTNECTYYQQACTQYGGQYYCETAPAACDWFFKTPDPNPTVDNDYEGWFRCTRQCLQDCDAKFHATHNNCGKPDPHTDDFWDPQNTQCHAYCYSTCAPPPVGGNPEF